MWKCDDRGREGSDASTGQRYPGLLEGTRIWDRGLGPVPPPAPAAHALAAEPVLICAAAPGGEHRRNSGTHTVPGSSGLVEPAGTARRPAEAGPQAGWPGRSRGSGVASLAGRVAPGAAASARLSSRLVRRRARIGASGSKDECRCRNSALRQPHTRPAAPPGGERARAGSRDV